MSREMIDHVHDHVVTIEDKLDKILEGIGLLLLTIHPEAVTVMRGERLMVKVPMEDREEEMP